MDRDGRPPPPHVSADDGDLPFRLLMENSAIGMAVVAPDGSFLTVNPALCSILGRDESSLTSATWQELTHPEDLRVDEALVGDVLAGRRERYRLRKRFLRPDRTIVWGDLSVACVRQDAGEVSYFVSQIVDVTEQVEASAGMQASEARYRLLAENASDVVTLVNVDGTLEWASPSLERTLGWDPAVVSGSPVWELVHPDDHALVAEVLASDDATIHALPDVEFRLRRADGSFAWMLAAGRRANETQLVVSIRLIEDQVRTRELLTASQDHFRLLAENASDVVLRTGSDGRLAWVSPSALDVLGWEPEQLVGRRFPDLIHPDDLAAGKARMAEALRTGGRPPVVEARVAMVDGSWLWMADQGRIVRDADGRMVGGIDALRDIHAEVEAREALRTSEAQYRLLADNATDVVYLVGPDVRVSWMSPTVSQTLGWSPEELMGTLMDDLIHPGDLGTPARFRRKDGSYTWMAWNTTTTFGPDGDMVSAVTGMKDVDDLITARDRALAEETRLTATLDSLIDPHVLWNPVRGADGGILDFAYISVNDAACDYMRMPHAAFVGSSLLTVLPGHEGSEIFDQYVEAVESGLPLALDDYLYANELLGEERRCDIRAVRVGDVLSCTWRDVTDRHAAAERIRQSEQHFRLLADNSSDVVLHSRDGIVLWVSPSLSRTLGWLPEDVTGTDSRLLVHPDDVAGLVERGALMNGTRVMRYRLQASDGRYHWCEVHSTDYVDDDGVLNGMVSSFRTVDDEVEAERELERRAMFDELTGVYKREEALARLETINQNARRTGAEAAVLFCDVDNLKQVNDENGHAVGDELLRALTARLVGAVRSSDTIARVGGDEFLVILDGVHGLDEAKALAEKIRLAALEPLDLPHAVISTSLSIGLTLARMGEDAEQTIARADRAMYTAKRAGRNTVRALNPA